MTTRPCIWATLLASGAAMAEPNMRPGLWEVSMTMEMPDLPVAPPPYTQRICLTEKDVESGAKAVPQDAQSGCRMTGYQLKGNTAHWTMECQGMTGQGSMTFSEDDYTGTSVLTMDMDGQTQRMSQSFTGKRVGDCQN